MILKPLLLLGQPSNAYNSHRPGSAAKYSLFLVVLLYLSSFSSSCTSSGARGGPARESSRAPDIRVCLAENLQEGSLAFRGDYRLEMEEAIYQLDESVGTFMFEVQAGIMRLRSERRYFELEAPQTLVFKPKLKSSQFLFNDIPYGGDLFLYLTDQGVTVVNEVGIERYLLGVIPQEMPSNEAEYTEAVVAQTIASRSYAMYRLNIAPQSKLYHIRADESDQIYRGLSKSGLISDQAVPATRGIILTLQDQPGLSEYHSTCGGVLESPSDTASLPGLAKDGVSYDLSRGQDNCILSPSYRWVEVRRIETILHNVQSLRQIDSVVVADWIENGYTLEVVIMERRPSGRVDAVAVNLNGESHVFSGSSVRRALANRAGEPLPSEFFFINASSKNPQKMYIIGAGAGHGRGMCQWGAIGMALKGFNHKQILSFYYPNFKLSKAY